MGQVIRIIDGPLAPIPCASERAFVSCEECVDETTCGTRQVMKKVRDAIAAILDRTTLADVQTQIARARLSHRNTGHLQHLRRSTTNREDRMSAFARDISL